MKQPSAEDIAAAGLLLGRVWLRKWDVPGSKGLWRVEERFDTRNGGTYVYCPCPAWKYNGLSCKHTDYLVDMGLM